MTGHVMSSRQLDQLWHLDFKLAQELLGLPLRKCTAAPVESWGNPMEAGKFEKLKLHVRRMWIRAAVHFSSVFNGTVGWSIIVNEHCERNLSLTENSFTVLGWIAAAPPPQECPICPTAHRYLRSPIGTNLYLGGPISLANWSSTPTVKCYSSSTKRPENEGNFYVSTIKPLSVGTPITWNYGLVTKSPMFYPVEEWQIGDCCSEISADAVLDVPCSSCTSKRKARPTFKRARIVQSYRFCVYCGINLEVLCGEYSNPGKSLSSKKTSKPHFALHHAVQLCQDQGLEVDSESVGVSHSSFLSHLHVVSRVLTSLENHNYQVVPACHIFQTLGRDQLSDDASADEKDQFFCDFMYEAKEAFRKYRILYVRGINVPSCYEDLLPVPNTTYSDVSWEGCKAPRSNSFSVKHVVPNELMPSLEQEIQISMENVVKTYSDLCSE